MLAALVRAVKGIILRAGGIGDLPDIGDVEFREMKYAHWNRSFWSNGQAVRREIHGD